MQAHPDWNWTKHTRHFHICTFKAESARCNAALRIVIFAHFADYYWRFLESLDPIFRVG